MPVLRSIHQNYINGQWVNASSISMFDVIQPSTAQIIGQMPLSNTSIVDQAVKSAKSAFVQYGQFSTSEKVAIISRIIDLYELSMDDMAHAISCEMGAPKSLALNLQAQVGLRLLDNMRSTLSAYPENHALGCAQVYKEPIGVAGMITPWNWPMVQVISKVSAALAAGCTMVLKPSEYAPYSAALLTNIIHEAQIPAGVFNLVFGGVEAGSALAAHPDVDIISITGSTQAGISVAKAAAPSVKRVTQELGGKSPFIVLPGADIALAVASCLQRLLLNSGQSCNAPTRLLVPKQHYQSVLAEIKLLISNYKVGDPFCDDSNLGPVVNIKQFERINQLIQSAIDDGASVLCGGVSTREPNAGYYINPTVLYDLHDKMSIVKEEVFGPVLCVLAYGNEDDAVAMANNTDYGLSAYIYADEVSIAKTFAKNIRAGMIHINNAAGQMDTPFGGYKKSGNGRERGVYGLEEYLESKVIFSE